MSLVVSAVGLSSLADERAAHFARLGEGPELFLELMLRTAAAWRIDWRGRRAGYCLSSADRLLVELDLERPLGAEGPHVFGALCRRLALRGAWCPSFDSLLLGLGHGVGWTSAVEGPLFRDLADDRGPAPTEHPGLRLRPAVAADVDAILPHRADVFGDDEECREWVGRDLVSVLERDGQFLGIGLLTRVWGTRREHDVGVMVHPDHRGRGYASFVLRSLKRRCLDLGMRPTAGCSRENVASAAALRRAGFVSRHGLLRLRAPGGEG